jgi:hypothetical protein
MGGASAVGLGVSVKEPSDKAGELVGFPRWSMGVSTQSVGREGRAGDSESGRRGGREIKGVETLSRACA